MNFTKNMLDLLHKVRFFGLSKQTGKTLKIGKGKKRRQEEKITR